MHLIAAAKRAGATVAYGVDASWDRLRSNGNSPDGPVGVCAPAEHLPFEDASFDLSYTRFLLQYLEAPGVAIAEMCRVTRPGGTVVLQDLDAQLVTHYPRCERLEELLAEFLAGVDGRLDVFVGRKLFGLAREAGLVDLEVRAEAYHLIAGAADPVIMSAWQLKLDIALPSAAQVLGEAKADELCRLFLAYLADPGTLTYSTVFTVSGRVPGTHATGNGTAPAPRALASQGEQ
jgi:SAM-dependent methyltransferase